MASRSPMGKQDRNPCLGSSLRTQRSWSEVTVLNTVETTDVMVFRARRITMLRIIENHGMFPKIPKGRAFGRGTECDVK